MLRRIFLAFSLLCISLGIAGTVFAEGFPFPGKIDPTANTVKPGSIYQSGNTRYIVEKDGDKTKISEVRSSDSLTKDSRQFATYGSDGTLVLAKDKKGSDVAPADLAADTKIGSNDATIAGTATPATGADGMANDGISVIVTEKIPGADCTLVEGVKDGVTTRKYKCTVKSGFGTVVKMLGGLIKYTTFLTALLGILMVVFSGLQYATSAGDTKQQTTAVKRITKLVGGLILLMLMALILNTVAPWIYG